MVGGRVRRWMGGGHRLEETGLACVGELYKQVIHTHLYGRACAVWRPSGAHHLIEFVVRDLMSTEQRRRVANESTATACFVCGTLFRLCVCLTNFATRDLCRRPVVGTMPTIAYKLSQALVRSSGAVSNGFITYSSLNAKRMRGGGSTKRHKLGRETELLRCVHMY